MVFQYMHNNTNESKEVQLQEFLSTFYDVVSPISSSTNTDKQQTDDTVQSIQHGHVGITKVMLGAHLKRLLAYVCKYAISTFYQTRRLERKERLIMILNKKPERRTHADLTELVSHLR